MRRLVGVPTWVPVRHRFFHGRAADGAGGVVDGCPALAPA